MKRKKLLTVALCLCLLGALLITGAAVTKYKFTSSADKAVSEIKNRVNIAVSATSFTFRNVGKDGMLTCTATLSIEKTEADFYGVLNSVTLSGQEFGNTIYTAGKNNGNAVLPENVPLPSNDDGVYPLEWELTFSVPYKEGQSFYEVMLNFDYTTGLKPNVTQRYQTQIPITITVE